MSTESNAVTRLDSTHRRRVLCSPHSDGHIEANLHIGDVEADLQVGLQQQLSISVDRALLEA
jgi:hypothetical protein